MSNTTPTPSRDAAEGSHFTVEDAGSTTDAADLFQNDTTAGTAPRTSDEDATGSADAVAAAGAASGPGSQARPASTSATGSGTADIATAPSDTIDDTDRAEPAATAVSADAAPPSVDEQPHSLAALAGDDSIAHVFDQTNGVIEGLDGDSDGSAQSDVLSRSERADEDPAFEGFADSEVQGDGEGDDSRRTGN